MSDRAIAVGEQAAQATANETAQPPQAAGIRRWMAMLRMSLPMALCALALPVVMIVSLGLGKYPIAARDVFLFFIQKVFGVVYFTGDRMTLLNGILMEVRLRGRRLSEIPRRELARQMAYVPQVHREAFGYRVFDVVLMGRMPHNSFFGRYGEADFRMVRDCLEKTGISHLAERSYTEISGGERQLTLVARAMAQEARVFVMDEPTNGLDFGNQVRLLERIHGLAGAGYSFVFSTHHPDHAAAVARRVVMMREGKILACGQAGSFPEDEPQLLHRHLHQLQCGR